MTPRLAVIAALLVLASASHAFAQSGFVPTGSIVVECDTDCRIEMPAFDLVERAEPRESVSLGGLPAGTYELAIVSGQSAWDLTATVCGTATAIRVAGGEATVEPTSCAPFGYLAVTLPQGARADVAQRTLRTSTTAALYVGAYDVVLTSADGDEHTDTVVVSDGSTTEVGFAAADTTVTFVGAPLEAIVRISGAGAFDGPGPHVVAPGLYVVEVAAPGYVSTSFTLRVEAGAQLERGVELERILPGNARFVVSPPTALIQIDGDTHAAGDMITLAPGDYVATVTASGYETATVHVTVASEATETAEVQLVEVLGRLVLRLEPVDAVVRIAGRTYSLHETVHLRPNVYAVDISAPGFATFEGTVDIAPDVDTVLDVVLAPRFTDSVIATGVTHSHALRNDGTAWAWGHNSNGQLGDGTTQQRTTPVHVTGLTNATAITAGGWHSLALRIDGTVWAWGLNSNGRLGDGTTLQRTTPVHVTGLTDIAAITAGHWYSLALRNDGTAWAWGSNRYGQLGDGTTTDRHTPTHVTGLSDVTAMSARGWHSLALRDDGTAWAWGYNSNGQLGDGTTQDRSTPVRVTGLTNITRIAAGGLHSLALRDDGTVWAWGNNDHGQLGDGTTTDQHTPVRITGLTNITDIAAGHGYSLALRDDGTVAAWGNNSNGQLGDGTTRHRSTPVDVTGLTNITTISAGLDHSVGTRIDGTVWAWGNDRDGRLGTAVSTDGATPVQVSRLRDVPTPVVHASSAGRGATPQARDQPPLSTASQPRLTLWRASDRYGNDLLGHTQNTSTTIHTITVPAHVDATVGPENLLPNGDLGLVYVLTDLTPGTTLVVEMTDARRTWDMDTYLYLYDLTAGRIIADDDDSPDTNRSEITFSVEQGVRYAIIASSWGGSDTGPIALTINLR